MAVKAPYGGLLLFEVASAVKLDTRAPDSSGTQSGVFAGGSLQIWLRVPKGPWVREGTPVGGRSAGRVELKKRNRLDGGRNLSAP